MLATIHLLVGAAIGKYIGAWPLALGAGFVSHFFLDALPHTDQATLKDPTERGSLTLTDLILVWLDLVIALVVLFVLSRSIKLAPSILAGALGGLAPDFAHPLYHIAPLLRTTRPFSWFYQFHRGVQRTTSKKNWLKGAIVELVFAIAAITLLLL